MSFALSGNLSAKYEELGFTPKPCLLLHLRNPSEALSEQVVEENQHMAEMHELGAFFYIQNLQAVTLSTRVQRDAPLLVQVIERAIEDGFTQLLIDEFI